MRKSILTVITLFFALALPLFAWAGPDFFGTKAMAMSKPKPPVLTNVQKWNNYRTRITVKGATKPTDTYNFYYADWSGAASQNNSQWLKENGHMSSNIAPDMTGGVVMSMFNPSETGNNAIIYMITIKDADGNESEPLLGRVDISK